MKINNFKEKILCFLLPLIYVLGINSYTPSSIYDLARFYRYYEIFKNDSFFGESTQKIFYKIPDYATQFYLYVLAKLDLPIGLFLSVVTYVTVYVFLYVFQYMYFNTHKKKAKIYYYITILFSLSLPAILSGVRNIHALSFVALSFIYIHKKKYSYVFACLLYAGLVHYSTYIYLLLFVVYLMFNNKKIDLKKQIILTLCMSFLLLLLKLIPLSTCIRIVPYSIYLKFKVYLHQKDILISVVEQGKWKSVIIYIIFNYTPIISFIILFKSRLKNIKTKKKQLLLILLPCALTLSFPIVFSRYNYFLIYFLTSLAIIYFSKHKHFYIFVIIITSIYILQIIKFTKNFIQFN